MPAFETIAAPTVSRPQRALPADACDTHSHVFGPFDRFPPVAASVYALPEALPEFHSAMRTRLGVARGVLTQPAPYGLDPSAMLDAVRHSQGALRAIAVADSTITDAQLADWRAAGVCGLRFVEMRAPGGARYPGSIGFDELEKLASRMREAGLHAQLWANASDFALWLPRLLKLDLPLVLDHMGCPDVAKGTDGADFRALCDALGSGNLWIKLILCRVSRADPAGYSDVRPFHDALVAAGPDRLVWGSDWPYVRMSPAPDAGHMLDLFDAWIADEGLRQRILVDNPAQLYGFTT